MRFFRPTLTLTLTLTLLTIATTGATTTDQIRLRNRIITPTPTTTNHDHAATATSSAAAHTLSHTHVPLVLLLSSPLTPTTRADLSSSCSPHYRSLGGASLLLHTPHPLPGPCHALLSHLGASSHAFLPSDKMDADPTVLDAHSTLLLSFGGEGSDLVAGVADLPGVASASLVSPHRVRVVVAESGRGGEVAALLAQHPGVEWVQGGHKVKSRNRFSRSVLQAGPGPADAAHSVDSAPTPFWDAGISGQGMVASCGDTGVDTDHCFFVDTNVSVPYNVYSPHHRKFASYIALENKRDAVDGHGSHVVGTFVGSANKGGLPGKYDGIAKDARIVFTDLGDQYGDLFPPFDLSEGYFKKPYEYGARVHSDSWGGDSVLYDFLCEDVDRFQWDHQDFLYVIAAGNTGSAGFDTVATPGNAKNGLSIGSQYSSHFCFEHKCGVVDDQVSTTCSPSMLSELKARPETYTAQNMACYSSFGPTGPDKRLKPDLVTPGHYVWSARSDGDPASSSNSCYDGKPWLMTETGTSMAAPSAAGSALLLRQYLVEGRWPDGKPSKARAVLPSASLLKALLLAGATKLEGGLYWGCRDTRAQIPPSVNYYTGFGSLTLNETVPLSETTPLKLLFDANDHTAETDTVRARCFDLRSSQGASQTHASLSIHLVWQDYPASPAASSSLVNDLDLWAQGPDSRGIFGNSQLPDGNPWGPDRRNNVEYVSFSNPTPGPFRVRVTGHAVPHGPQPYALVVRYRGEGQLVDISCDSVSWPDPVSGRPGAGSGSDSSTSRIVLGFFITLSVLLALVVLGVILYRRFKPSSRAVPFRFSLLDEEGEGAVRASQDSFLSDLSSSSAVSSDSIVDAVPSVATTASPSPIPGPAPPPPRSTSRARPAANDEADDNNEPDDNNEAEEEELRTTE